MATAEFQERVNSSFEPVLSCIPTNGYSYTEIPILMMNPQTYRLMRMDALYWAINFTRTNTGAITLRRSLNQPLQDTELIRAKQRSVEEVRLDQALRGILDNSVKSAAPHEPFLYSYYRQGYSVGWRGHPNIYDAFKGSQRLLLSLAEGLTDVPAQTDYLNALLQNLSDFRISDVFDYIERPVCRTFTRLKPLRQVGERFLEPFIEFKATDWKLYRFIWGGMPAALALPAFLFGDGELALAGASGATLLYSIWPRLITSWGRRFDNKIYALPLKKLFFGSPEVIYALESLGKIDELLSLADYADCLKVPVTLPGIEDSPQPFFEATNLINPVLARENPHVPHNVDLNSSQITFLQARVLAQIGSYIPAERAKMSVADRISF